MRKVCKLPQSEKIKKGEPCSDCGRLIAGGFRFEDRVRKGWRCFGCLMIDIEKTRGVSGIDQISQILHETPKLDGRKWKSFALKLKEQRETIARVVALYKVENEALIRRGDG